MDEVVKGDIPAEMNQSTLSASLISSTLVQCEYYVRKFASLVYGRLFNFQLDARERWYSTCTDNLVNVIDEPIKGVHNLALERFTYKDEALKRFLWSII